MATFDDWLSRLKAAGKGPVTLYAPRHQIFTKAIVIDANLTGATMSGAVRAYPGAPGSALANFTVSGPSVVGSETTFTISLPKATVEALPEPNPGDTDVVLVYDLKIDTATASEEVFFGGEFVVIEGVKT